MSKIKIIETNKNLLSSAQTIFNGILELQSDADTQIRTIKTIETKILDIEKIKSEKEREEREVQEEKDTAGQETQKMQDTVLQEITEPQPTETEAEPVATSEPAATSEPQAVKEEIKMDSVQTEVISTETEMIQEKPEDIKEVKKAPAKRLVPKPEEKPEMVQTSNPLIQRPVGSQPAKPSSY
ncbi:MAG: hypothetical protein RSC60_05305, partial [Christensenellaceae bacterium]